jgi:hypothetical protein
MLLSLAQLLLLTMLTPDDDKKTLVAAQSKQRIRNNTTDKNPITLQLLSLSTKFLIAQSFH